MRRVLRSLPQMFVIAGVVATALNAVEGFVAWCAVLFVPAAAYSACVVPWGAKKD